MNRIEWKTLAWVMAGGSYVGSFVGVFSEGDFTPFDFGVWPIVLAVACMSIWRLRSGKPWWTPFTSLREFVQLGIAWGLAWGCQLELSQSLTALAGRPARIFDDWSSQSPLLFAIVSVGLMAHAWLLLRDGPSHDPVVRHRRFIVNASYFPIHLAIGISAIFLSFPLFSGDAAVGFGSAQIVLPLAGLIVADGPWRTPAIDGDAASA